MSYGYQPQYPPHYPQRSSSKSTLFVLGLVFGGLAIVGVCVIGLLLALLPGVMAAREAAAKATSRHNLMQIGLAFHDFHDTYRRLPKGYGPRREGESRVSWRVELLPFLEQKNVYDDYHFNASWDHPDNLRVRQTPLRIFHNPLDQPKESTKTSYAIVMGAQTPWDKPQHFKIYDFADGLANTVMVVEIKNSDIEWSEPRDLDFKTLTTDPNSPNAVDLAGGAVVLFADASSRILPRDTNLQTLRAYLTHASGEMVTTP